MIILVGFSFETNAQKNSTEKLDLMFNDYKIVNINSKSIHETSRNNHFFEIDIPKQKDNEFWKVELHNSGIIGDNYISQYTSDTGVKTGKKTTAVPTKGHIVGKLNTSVSLTFNEGFIYGFIKDKTGYNYIEPLSYYDNQQRGNDLYVIYNDKDLKPSAPHSCGSTELQGVSDNIISQTKEESDSRVDECYDVEYAIANDFLMFQEYGSLAATEDHAIGVTNNVQENYDDEFADELQLIIVTQYTATSAATDPWTSSTSANALLNSFRNWGPGGFAAVHDVGSLWTDRNFNGSTVGIAYLTVICTGNRYNCLMNFTTNPVTKRMMVAHELGHNFGSGHDPSGSFTIMAPTVNSATTWSSQSVNAINNHVASRWCLSDCAGSSAPPDASFSFNVIEECTPGLVQFTNSTTGNGTIDYEWDFPGGTPSFSTEENPLVTYNNAGNFNATLTATNIAGSDVETQNGIVDILASPEPDFGYFIEGTVVDFFNFSQNATNYFWEFGDGVSSSSTDPIHNYFDDGIYVVQLTASSACGDITIEKIIVIANPPTADFDADVQVGCALLTVQYTSTSSNNTDDYIWTFEGGIPAVSTEENPTVTYSEAGTFDVTLTVINETGEDVLAFTDFVTVKDVPLSDFSYTINEDEVTFTNFTIGGDSYLWDFGDSNSSTEENPIHTYATDGDFEVILTVTNECGENGATSTISISLLPIASFSTTGGTTDCATFAVNFESTSTNDPEVFEWVFEGGTPATSSMANPSVSYSAPGAYDVSLTVSNANGINALTMPDYVTVLDEPISAFNYAESGLEVTFEDTSTDGDSYAWDFGDSNTSTEANPTNTYGAEGIYTVELAVTNQCGTNTSTQTLNNYTPVSANFSSDITSGCANLVVDFGDESSDNVTAWLWTFEGGTPATSTEENPTVMYDVAGQYDVVLTVSHPESTETITLVNYVAVSDAPIPSFDYFDDIFNVDFLNTTIEGDSYSWDFGDGNTSTEENPSHTYAEEGEFEVVLTATNECGTTTSMASVSINALPIAGLNSDVSSGCGPLTVQFNDASSSNVTEWAWTFEGGNPSTSTDENPTVEYASPGNYNVELLVTSAAGTDMIVMDDFIAVLEAPTADINFILDGNEITATDGGSGGTSITWTVGNTESNEDELVYIAPDNGTYTVNLTTENECGTDTESVDIIVNVYAEANIGGLPIIACVGDEVQIIDNSSNADDWLWTLEGGSPNSSTDESPTITYEAEGTYSITLKVTNQYNESTETFTDAVTVIGLPNATFDGTQINNMVTFATTASNTTTYAWDFGDGNTSTEENPSHTFNENGIYEVKLTVTNECGEYFVTESYIIISNSVTEAELAGVNIYPNPAKNILNIQLTNSDSDKINMDVLDINGKLVLSNTFNTANHTIDVSKMPAGTYLIRLKSEEASYYKKVIVLK